MYPEFSTTISESDYSDCVKQSNEILIPRPLVLCFHFPLQRPRHDYLTDLQHELKLKGRLFDRDREVHQLGWDNRGETDISSLEKERLMVMVRSQFQLSPDFSLARARNDSLAGSGFDLVGFGLGAISRIDNNYFQNTADPDRYHTHLALRQLPVTRGCRR